MKQNNQNPMGDQRDHRNLFLAIILSLAVLLGWQQFVEKPRYEAQQAAAQMAADPVNAPVAPAPASAEPAVPAAPRERAVVLADNPRRAIQSDALHGSVSLKGGRIDDITLARYHEQLDKSSPEIVLMSPAGVEQPYYAEFGWRAQGVAVPDQNTVWNAASGEALAPGKPLVLSWDNGAGLTFEKKIEIDDNYLFTITQSVTNTSGAAVTLHPYGLVARDTPPNPDAMFLQHEGAIGVFEGKLHEDTYKDLASDAIMKRTTTGGWFGFTDKYWLVALMPAQDKPISTRALHAPQVGAHRYQVDYLDDAGIKVEAGATASSTTHLFAGAKELGLLDQYEKAIGVKHLDLAIDFGWFYFLTKPFFYALNWLAGALGGFGLAILAFTVVVKLLLFPLADHAYFSMAKMKVLMPKLQELRQTYANDPQKQSQAMMELYKKEGVHPLSGCWPILIQIPIFFALYKVLFVSIEMRHAPFYGWIHDLSAADPSNIFTLFGLLPWASPLHIGALPIMMGVTMWLQMKMSPPPTDPAQRIVFGLMPVILTVSMASFPAGLVIYWTWSNVLGVLQQYYIMRKVGGEDVSLVRGHAQRRKPKK